MQPLLTLHFQFLQTRDVMLAETNYTPGSTCLASYWIFYILHHTAHPQCSGNKCIASMHIDTNHTVFPILPPPPLVQRTLCPTNTSVRTVFFEDLIN